MFFILANSYKTQKKCHYVAFLLRVAFHLGLHCILDTGKGVLWQTVQILMKCTLCGISSESSLHFIWVFTICQANFEDPDEMPHKVHFIRICTYAKVPVSRMKRVKQTCAAVVQGARSLVYPVIYLPVYTSSET